MPSNARIARIAFKMAFSGLFSLHQSVMGFYDAVENALDALRKNDSQALDSALLQMNRHAGISVKMLSIANAFEAAGKSGLSDRIASYFKQAFGALLPDMQRTYDFYGKGAKPFKSEFEKLAKKIGIKIRSL